MTELLQLPGKIMMNPESLVRLSVLPDPLLHLFVDLLQLGVPKELKKTSGAEPLLLPKSQNSFPSTGVAPAGD